MLDEGLADPLEANNGVETESSTPVEPFTALNKTVELPPQAINYIDNGWLLINNDEEEPIKSIEEENKPELFDWIGTNN